MTNEYDAVRQSLADLDASYQTQLLDMAKAMRALCEHRDELEFCLDAAVKELSRTTNVSENLCRARINDQYESRVRS